MNVVNGLFWHPKIIKAADLLNGQASRTEVFTLYVLGLSYAHQHLTDGFLPQGAVENLWKECGERVRRKFKASSSQVHNGFDVAKVLSRRDIRLWHQVKGGYQIHDYLKHNPSASAVKTKREKNRLRQQAWRLSQG